MLMLCVLTVVSSYTSSITARHLVVFRSDHDAKRPDCARRCHHVLLLPSKLLEHSRCLQPYPAQRIIGLVAGALFPIFLFLKCYVTLFLSRGLPVLYPTVVTLYSHSGLVGFLYFLLRGFVTNSQVAKLIVSFLVDAKERSGRVVMKGSRTLFVSILVKECWVSKDERQVVVKRKRKSKGCTVRTNKWGKSRICLRNRRSSESG